MEKFAQEIEDGKHSEEKIKDFVERNILAQKVHQDRFMSTAMDVNSTKDYAKDILWTINVPKGTNGSMIENCNVERNSETEILIQKDSNLIIREAEYDFENQRWHICADLEQ